MRTWTLGSYDGLPPTEEETLILAYTSASEPLDDCMEPGTHWTRVIELEPVLDLLEQAQSAIYTIANGGSVYGTVLSDIDALRAAHKRS